MLRLPAKTIMRRSMPMPSPPVGGIPCSMAVRNSSSRRSVSSSSNRLRSCSCCSMRVPLVDGVVQLSERVAYLHAGDEPLKPLNEACESPRFFLANAVTSRRDSPRGNAGCTRCGSTVSDSSLSSSPPQLIWCPYFEADGGHFALQRLDVACLQEVDAAPTLDLLAQVESGPRRREVDGRPLELDRWLIRAPPSPS